jgi:hypothetical protein
MDGSGEPIENSFHKVNSPRLRHWATGNFLYQRDGLHHQAGIIPKLLEYKPRKLKSKANTEGSRADLLESFNQPKELDPATRLESSRYQQFDMQNLCYDQRMMVPILGKPQLKYIEITCSRLKGRNGLVLLPLPALRLNGQWSDYWIRIPGRFISEDTLLFCGFELKAANTILHQFYSRSSPIRCRQDEETTQFQYSIAFESQIQDYLHQEANNQVQSAPSEFWADQLQSMGFTEKACNDILRVAQQKLYKVTFKRKFSWIIQMAIAHVIDRILFLRIINRRLGEFVKMIKLPPSYVEYDLDNLHRITNKLRYEGDIFFEKFPVAQDARLPPTPPNQSDDTEWGFLRSPFTTPRMANNKTSTL